VIAEARVARLALLYVLAAPFEPVVVLAYEFRVIEGDPLVIGGECGFVCHYLVPM
jgi:hypothetical protein